MGKAWKKMSERLVFDHYRKILRRGFVLPNNKEVDYEVFTGPDFVVVAAFTENGEAIINKQFRAGPETFLYSFPSGMVDEGETPEQAGRRELEEETGYEAGEMIFLKTSKINYGTFQQHCYLALDCTPTGKIRLDGSEFIENEIWSLDELKEKLRDNSESNLVHIDAVFMALDKLKLL